MPAKPSPGPESILMEAERLINGDRQKDYGPPGESFAKVGKLWEPILDIPVTAPQVVLCMVQLKVVRTLNGYHRDSITDLAGYAGVLELIHNTRGTIM